MDRTGKVHVGKAMQWTSCHRMAIAAQKLRRTPSDVRGSPGQL